MKSDIRLWSGLGTAFLFGVTGVSGGHAAEAADDGQAATVEAGEAEGSEGGEGAGAADAVTSDVAYRTQLALMRGHLLVGVDLYHHGEYSAATTHMKHPEDELYAAMEPAFEARNAAGFGQQLSALATAVDNRAGRLEVDAAYVELLSAIRAAERAVEPLDAHQTATVITALVRTAAEEYAIARGDDGSLRNAHEYQDALGFTRVARDLLRQMQGQTDNADALAVIEAQLMTIEPAWPGLLPPDTLETDASILYGAAARIELAANRL
ncbi:MAG: hypothetical protein ACQETO_13830 [Pseudomonadota bacterium]